MSVINNEAVFVKLSPTMGLLIQGICYVKYMLCYLFNIFFFDLMIRRTHLKQLDMQVRQKSRTLKKKQKTKHKNRRVIWSS